MFVKNTSLRGLTRYSQLRSKLVRHSIYRWGRLARVGRVVRAREKGKKGDQPDLDKIIQNQDEEQQEEISQVDKGQENLENNERQSVEEADLDEMFGIQRYDQQYKQFQLEGCDFLIAENEEGMLDLNDVYVQEHETEIYARPIIDYNNRELPPGPRFFQDLPWQEEQSADSLKQEYNTKLTVRKIILTEIESKNPYNLDLLETFILDSKLKHLVLPLIEWKCMSDNPVLRIREDKVSIEDVDNLSPPGWPIMMHMGRQQGQSKEADQFEELFDFASSAVVTNDEWEAVISNLKQEEQERQRRREAGEEDELDKILDNYYDTFDVDSFLEAEKDNTERLLKFMMTGEMPPEENKEGKPKKEDVDEESEMVQVISEEGGVEEEEDDVNFEFEEEEAEEEEIEEDDMEGMDEFGGDDDMEMEMEVDQPTVDLI
eukprot:TRINITY_DN6798_c2_g2_i1.p1 TRINITY_DN6798_c2_g2~~TRINITY_DN6798_c2_g2_i1.p1  ORF type:complete len:431 (-),score=119.00 TRINITY_DN6798_c2_g2_i1:170-1462(-)